MPKTKTSQFVTNFGKKYSDNLIYGVAFTFAMVALSMVGLPTMWIATSFIVLVHLRHDFSQSAIIAFVAVLTIFFISGSYNAFIPILAVVLAAELYKRYHSLMLSFEALIILAMLSVILIHLFVPDISSWWIARFDPIKEIVLNDKSVDAKQVNEAFIAMSKIATGLTAISAILSAMLGLTIGSIWYAAIEKKTKKLSNELLGARMGLIVPILSLFGIVAWLLKYNWMVDMLPIVIGALSLYGLYVFICVSWYLFKKPIWIYIMFLLGLFLYMSFDVFKIFIVLIAVTDYFANWREIFKKVSVDTKD